MFPVNVDPVSRAMGLAKRAVSLWAVEVAEAVVEVVVEDLLTMAILAHRILVSLALVQRLATDSSALVKRDMQV